MKKIVVFSMLISLVSLTSYGKQHDSNSENNSDSSTVNFTINSKIGTRTTTVSRYVLEIYEGTDVTSGNRIHHVESSANNFSLELKENVDYVCLLWADGGTADDNVLGTYNAASLKEVKLNAFKEMTEAFYANAIFRITSTTSTSIALKHAMAKVVLIETGTITTNEILAITFDGYTTFNVFNGTVLGGTTIITRAFANPTSNKVVGDFFAFASIGTNTTGGTITNFEAIYSSPAPVTTNIEARLAVNYTTNLIGTFTE